MAHKLFSIEKALIYHPDVRKFAAEHPTAFRGKDHYLVLAKMACFSVYYQGLLLKPELLEKFGRLYSYQPDETIEFLSVARSIVLKWEKTQAGKVIKFLCRRASIPIETRQAVLNPKGERIALIIKHRLTGETKKISLEKLSEAEINGAMFSTSVPIASLLDKELSQLLNVPADSIKKARQELAKIAHEIAFWDNDIVAYFMQTGVELPELAALREAYSKGKK